MFASEIAPPMYPENTVIEYLLDSDGSTRDITFTPCDKDALIVFFEDLSTTYSVAEINDNDGIDGSGAARRREWQDLYSAPKGYHHGLWDGGDDALFSRIQTFVDWPDEKTGRFCVEISYFPDEVRADQFTLNRFRETIDSWRALLGSEGYFVRYENASWDEYDDKGLGVIYTRSRPPLQPA